VVLEFDYSDAQLLHLLAHDSDPFNRWEAGQRLALRCALTAVRPCRRHTRQRGAHDAYMDAMRGILRTPQLDAAFKELVLTLPSETYLAEQLDVVDPQQHPRRARSHAPADWPTHCTTTGSKPTRPTRTPAPTARSGVWRANVPWPAWRWACCAWASATATRVARQDLQRFKEAGNMTDRLATRWPRSWPAAIHWPTRPCCDFHAMFKDDELVLDKWFALQAGAPTAKATSCRWCAS
jgi:aminopeptidase N